MFQEVFVTPTHLTPFLNYGILDHKHAVGIANKLLVFLVSFAAFEFQKPLLLRLVCNLLFLNHEVEVLLGEIEPDGVVGLKEPFFFIDIIGKDVDSFKFIDTSKTIFYHTRHSTPFYWYYHFSTWKHAEKHLTGYPCLPLRWWWQPCLRRKSGPPSRFGTENSLWSSSWCLRRTPVSGRPGSCRFRRPTPRSGWSTGISRIPHAPAEWSCRTKRWCL